MYKGNPKRQTERYPDCSLCGDPEPIHTQEETERAP